MSATLNPRSTRAGRRRSWHPAGGDAEWSVQHEAGIFHWEECRRGLIAQVARAEAAGGPFEDYETWLAVFEGVLAPKGLVRADEVEESAYAFEYGERDEVY